LEGLLRSGKELKVFAVRNEDLNKFAMEAKRYGVLYCALRDKKSLDGMCDIMVRAEDASKINRIVERFKLVTVDMAGIKSEIQKSRTAKQEDKAPAAKETPAEKGTGDFLDKIMTKTDQSEPAVPQTDNPNPTTATTEKSRSSEPTYERSGKAAEGTIEPERKSIRQELKEIKEAQSEQAEPKREAVKEQGKSTKPPAQLNKPKAKNEFKKPKER